MMGGKKGSRRPPRRGKKAAVAFSQLDYQSKNAQKCVYPQMTALEAIHEEHPQATFFLLSRPLDDWINSTERWWYGNLMHTRDQMTACDLPGLPQGVGSDNDDLKQWVCQHQQNVRHFVEQHPSHALIELNLYDDSNFNDNILTKLLGPQAQGCFGHSNQNQRIRPKKPKSGKRSNENNSGKQMVDQEELSDIDEAGDNGQDDDEFENGGSYEEEGDDDEPRERSFTH